MNNILLKLLKLYETGEWTEILKQKFVFSLTVSQNLESNRNFESFFHPNHSLHSESSR